MTSERDKSLALMVYETWLLNGATPESMPSLRLRKWCNGLLNRDLFPVDYKRASARRAGDDG